MDYKALGRQLREKRKQLNLTQVQVAIMAGLSVSFYGHVERGTRKASIETLLSLARILRTTPDALLSHDIECTVPETVEKSISAMRVMLAQLESFLGSHTK